MSANWKDFVKTANESMEVVHRNPVTGLGYDKNWLPVIDFSKLPPVQKGTDAHQSVMSAAPDRPKVDYKKLMEDIAMGGNGNPDEMLGKRMNPILIAPGMVAGGAPATAMSAIRHGALANLIANGMERLSESHPTAAKAIAAANIGMTAAPFLQRKTAIIVPHKENNSGNGPDPYFSPPMPFLSSGNKALAKARAKVGNRILGSKAWDEMKSHGLLHVSDVKRYLMSKIRDGGFSGSGRSRRELKSIVRKMNVSTDRESLAEPLGSTPIMKLKSDGDGFVDTTELRHEFGHIADLFGLPEWHPKKQQINAIRNGLDLSKLWMGDALNPETRANISGGLPKRTPNIDLYESYSAGPKTLIKLMRKYPVRKPNLPE